MARNHLAGQHAAPPYTPQRSILPLPEDVIAQITASTAIVSLGGVVVELLSNSLDAKATKVQVTIDFARGGCTVEDDGLGIAPFEFGEDGGLAKLYRTSMYHNSALQLTRLDSSKDPSHDALLGRNGTFLASLAATSLVTVTSRHHQHRSHNSITLHHSKPIERQLPASANDQVHGKHGTRVTVRNLFGNLPVRVKHRSVLSDRNPEHDRLWETLKRHVVALLLSWRGTVSVKVRHGDNKTGFNFHASKSTTTQQSPHDSAAKLRSPQLSSMLNLLTQANYISINEWASWVLASASTTTLSIKGAISLKPAPSKHVQFISLGIRPLIAESGHHELYDEINRLFALSSFGTIEADGDTDGIESSHRQNDNRFNSNEYTNRQRKARKDVDRYPMFHLRVSFNRTLKTNISEDRLVESEADLRVVLEVLGAMITQWLSVHHFRPRLPRKKRGQSIAMSASTSDTTVVDKASTPGIVSASTVQMALSDSSDVRTHKPRPTTTATRKRKGPIVRTIQERSDTIAHRAFAEWSRIKSGRPDFFHSLPTLPKLCQGSEAEILAEVSAFPLDKVRDFANFEVQPIPQDAFSALTASDIELVDQSCAVNSEDDATFMWTDPCTKLTHLLNARTGCVMPNAQRRPHTDSATSMFAVAQADCNKPLRIAPKLAGMEVGKTPWLDDVLQSWDNPIFKPSENRIQQVSLQDNDFEIGGDQPPHHCCSHSSIAKMFGEALTLGVYKLSKVGLKNAHVIAQVDKKFILVRIQNSLDTVPEQHSLTELLVLIDQHAADERVQVETLLEELCTPLAWNESHPSPQSKLGHKVQVASVLLEKPVRFSVSPREGTHFVTHAARLASWGILYDILDSIPSSRHGPAEKHQAWLSVTMLPPAISARCASDPQLLISFLRSTIWAYNSNPHLPPLPSTSIPRENDPTDWIRHLAICPPALIDLINSRACRSAIMFNDVLNYEECEDVVRKLSNCVFPFMCAHGRPSMVPLVELGRIGQVAGSQHGKVNGEPKGEGSFARAWKVWEKGKQHTNRHVVM